MKKLQTQIERIERVIFQKKILSVSFDIDGTLYPLSRAKVRWWTLFLVRPQMALRFLSIKKLWEQRRKGDQSVPVSEDDIRFFEEFLLGLYSPGFVPPAIFHWIELLGQRGVRIIFLSDHGAGLKLSALGIPATEMFNCVREAGELKPHRKIALAFQKNFAIDPDRHLHLGDRWTDEEQALLMGCQFEYLIC